MPERIQRKRTKGWRMPEGAVYVGRPTEWGNPFQYRHYTGLVHYQPSAPDRIDYEGRISADGMRHDYHGPGGTVTELWVRYATRAELVELYRRTLVDPTPSMRSSCPPDGRFLKVTVEDIRRELAGKDLACWCAPADPCHVDVLLALANPCQKCGTDHNGHTAASMQAKAACVAAQSAGIARIAADLSTRVACTPGGAE